MLKVILSGIVFSVMVSMQSAALEVRQTMEPMVIDGKLEEKIWSEAPAGKNFTNLRRTMQSEMSPRADTTFRVLTDGENIYVGIRCEESEMAKLHSSARSGDTGNIWKDDLVEIYFSAMNSPDEYYQFAINPDNATFQMFFGESGKIRPDAYAPKYDVATFKGTNFWSVELCIPLRALYMTKSKFMSEEWFFNVSRQMMYPKAYQWSSWAGLDNRFNEIPSFHKVGKFPIKDRYCDILIKRVAGVMRGNDTGNLIFNVEVEPACAGNYSLTIASPDLKSPRSQEVTLNNGDNRIELTGFEWKRTGKVELELSLKNSAGKVVAERFYTVELQYDPLIVELTAPAYAGSFFPGENRDFLRGRYTISTPADKLTADFGSFHREYPLDGRKSGEFELNVAGGDFTGTPLKISLYQGEKLLAAKSFPISAPQHDGKKTIRISENGKIVVDGVNTFIRTWYNGENRWCVSRALLEKYPTINAKHPANVSEWVNIEPNRLVAGSEAKEGTRDVKPSPEVMAALKKRIDESKGRNFEFYYLGDEPELRNVSPVYLKYIYDYAKLLDPIHPIVIVSRDAVKYIDCADILSPHPYINPVETNGKRILRVDVGSIRSHCRAIIQAGRKNKAVMITPQVFSYAFNNLDAVYPNFDETNASIWSAIANGAQGVAPFVWYGHMNRPELNVGMDYIYESLERLGNLLSSDEKVSATSSNPSVDAAAFAHNGVKMLLLVNVSDREESAEITSELFQKPGKWFFFREGRELNLQDGHAKWTLAPYQVVILLDRPMDENLKDVANLREAISRSEAARRDRGNLLFGRDKELSVTGTHCKYVYQPALEQRDLLFDGIIDNLGWCPRDYEDELFYEVAFPKFVPKFKQLRIYGYGLDGMKLKIWKYGEWVEPEAKVSDGKYYREYRFDKIQSTVKIRFEFKTPPVDQRMHGLELYEIELLKD